jgi:SiaC family regulatory phosphoprotein
MHRLLPKINIVETEGEITISGNSLPENPIISYQPIFDYLNKVKQEKLIKNVKLKIDVEIFSSSSLKMIVEIFNLLNNLETNNITHSIEWLYAAQDEDTLEKAEMASSIIPVKIKFTKK